MPRHRVEEQGRRNGLSVRVGTTDHQGLPIIELDQAEASIAQVAQRLKANQDLYQDLLKRYTEAVALRENQQPDARVISPAQIPLKPSHPNFPRIIALSFVGSISLAVFPNPTRAGAEVRVSAAPPGARVEVLDASGRRIATLSPAGAASGTWTWNGADDAGRPVPPGRYVMRVSARGEVRQAPLVKLR